MENQRYQARWILPSDSEPIENGVLEIQDSVIVGYSHKNDPAAINLGNVAIIPGLVNAHTHLEFSDLSKPIEPAVPFDTWIRNLVGHRMSRDIAVGEIVHSGLQQSQEHGIVAVGEIATQGWTPEPFDQSTIQSVVFRELIGLLDEQLEEQLDIARQHLGIKTSNRVVTGLSPHAPFSVHPDLLDSLLNLAAMQDAPVTMHVAETRAELELLQLQSGPLVEMLKSFGVWNPRAFRSPRKPLDILRELSRVNRALVIHGNYLDQDEIEFLSEHQHLSVVYCPRTHAYFQHDQHPWQAMLEAGVSLAIGTDGRGSNPDLSIWDELRFLHRRFPPVTPKNIIRLGTEAGANALRLKDYGLRPGCRSTLSVVELPPTDSTSVFDLLFSAGAKAGPLITCVQK